MKPKYKGFSKLVKDHAGHIDVGQILSTNTDVLLNSLVWHSLKLGAYIAFSTNRSLSAMQVYLKFGEDEVKEWCNTPEEAVEKLSNLLDMVVATCRETGAISEAP